MSARERFNHAYDNRHRCGVLGAQDIEMMCAEIDRLRRQLDLSQGIGLRVVKLPDPDEDTA